MSYPNSLYAAVGGYTSKDFSQLQVIGMRRNSFVIALCSLIALASVSVYGCQLNLIIPVVSIPVVKTSTERMWRKVWIAGISFAGLIAVWAFTKIVNKATG